MRPVLLPELCHHTLFSSSSYGICIQQRYWSYSSFVHLGKKPLHQKRHSANNPQPTSMYISSSIILPFSSGWNNILSCKWLQWGLNNNIMTYMFKPFSCNISNLIMTHKCESPMAANHSMIRREGFTTHTMIRDVGQVHIKDV